ncbi:MAG TPA: T9SS type A sorting domain-containing protein [Flavobacteriales bacterium]|nr:T9SS type A sorting domain-containing protein [Flavobacteriales bacterium]
MRRHHTILLATSLVLLSATPARCVTVIMQSFPARCGLNNGSTRALPGNGIPPYTYVWSTGATTQTVSGLAPGTYDVTVTDAIGGVANGSTTVVALFELDLTASFMQFQPDCSSGCMGMVDVFEGSMSGSPPYSYSVAPQNLPSHFGYQGICAGAPNVITIADLNGCPGMFDLSTVIDNVENSVVQVNSITGSCEGQANGTLNVTLVGGSGASYVRLYSFTTQSDQFFHPALNSPYVITGLAAGEYSMSSWVNGWDGEPYCTNPYGQLTIPEVPTPCGVVSGTLFNDADQDCVQDPDEPGLPYRILTAQPGPRYGMTDAEGDYFIGTPFGSYTLSQPMVDEAQLCPVAVPVPFTVDGVTPAVTIDLADSSLVPHDLEVLLYSTAFRPGFPSHVWGSVRNNTAYASGAVSLSLGFPTLLQPVTSTAGGTITSGNIAWSFPILPAYSLQGFGFSGTVPADIALLGQELVITASASNSIGEGSLANNTTTLIRIITGSYDPNDKRGVANNSGSDTQFFLDADDWIDYTVRFQNTGTDTAFAVVIRDEIEQDLDLMSFEILGASHEFTPSFGEGRELVFTFNDILLPDSTSDLLGSQGYVAFRLKPRTGIVPGDLIENTAEIHFDFNDPVITEPSVLVAEVSTAIRTLDGDTAIHVFPNPVDQVLSITISGSAVPYTLEVLTLDGRLVAAHRPSGPSFNLNVGDLAAGSYCIHVIEADGGELRGRFFKQ